MRYIGNKTKLLGFLGSVLDGLPVRDGTAADPFAGTASVAQYFKRRGFAVVTSDIMSYSYAFQRAYVQLDVMPAFERLLHGDRELAASLTTPEFHAALESRSCAQGDLFAAGDDPRAPLRKVLVFLDTCLAPASGFISEAYSADDDAAADAGRMFFTRSNAQRIDAIRQRIEQWRRSGLMSDDEFFLLLAPLLEAADAVANTTGVYAAFVKSWQSNAVRPLRLREPEPLTGTGLHCVAHQEDAASLLARLGPVDVLYLDPPYNNRQYSSYYHVPEVIAEGWFDGVPALRGKTGLIPDAHKKSRWSMAGECVAAFRELIDEAQARYVLLSYNNEGIIPAAAIEDILRGAGRPGTFRIHTREYERYRSDRDRELRVYKGDQVTEFVYSVELSSRRSLRRTAS